MLMSLPARYWLKRRTMPGWSSPKALITNRSAGSCADVPGGPGRPDQHLVASPAGLGAADPFGQLLGIDRLGHADDHDQREVSAQHGLAARIDVAAQRFDGVAHRRHDAGVVVGHDREHKTVRKARHRLPVSGGGENDLMSSTHARTGRATAGSAAGSISDRRTASLYSSEAVWKVCHLRSRFIPFTMTDPASASSAPAPRWRPLNSIDRRVLGVLGEKAKTTPDAYPMSLNGVVAGCNQKSNRSPLMQLEPDQVEESLDRLRQFGAWPWSKVPDACKSTGITSTNGWA